MGCYIHDYTTQYKLIRIKKNYQYYVVCIQNTFSFDLLLQF